MPRGVKVLMKSGKAIWASETAFAQKGVAERTRVVQNCGLPGETIFPTLIESEDTAGYFTLLIVKES